MFKIRNYLDVEIYKRKEITMKKTELQELIKEEGIIVSSNDEWEQMDGEEFDYVKESKQD